MTNTMKIKLQGNLADPEFCSGMCSCMKAEEALAYFAQHGLELEEREALDTWNAAMEEDANRMGQLTDEELEQVAGGCLKVCQSVTKFGICIRWAC
ncbi:MAG: hypothetical protein RR139_09835 [Lachnospiraceae bacterium]